MTDLNAKPAGDKPTGSGSDAEVMQLDTTDYNRYSPSVSIDALLRFADLHESLAFFYLDKATAAVDAPLAEFNKWYGPCVDGLTWCEILRHGRTGLDVN